MEIIMEALLLLLLFAGFFSSMTFVVLLGKRSSSRIDWQQQPETEGLPYSRRNYFFSAAERSLYEILRRLTPEHTVFAKVRLADVVYVNGTVSRQSYVNRIDRKHLDFVVCDKNLAPVVAIELDDACHRGGELRARDEFLEQVLAAAALPIIRMPARRAYVMDEIHRLLSPYLRIGTLMP
jgi:very-short-patch-repair endonuclease